MKIPNIIATKVVNKDGYLSDEWREIFSQLFIQMRVSLSDEGFMVPKQTTDNIDQLAGTDKTGALLYDNDTHELKVNINGTYKKIQTS
jgi:hypothetical protein